jgi:hypothetical protein
VEVPKFGAEQKSVGERRREDFERTNPLSSQPSKMKRFLSSENDEFYNLSNQTRASAVAIVMM